MASASNPFHLEAVATYGVSLRTCEDLAYMGRAIEELRGYVKSYPVAERRYGGAIGLRGGHGSGKTHLLAWLTQKCEGFRHIQPVTLYGKADSAKLFDLYKQIVSQLERPRLLQLLDQATQNIAIEQVKAAKVTESIQERITSSEDLTTLYKEANLDREQIANILQARLVNFLQESSPGTQFTPGIAQTLLAVGSPAIGEDAYHWLLGDDIQDLSALGLSHNLRQVNEESVGSSAPDVVAVEALETMAALHRLAGVPLLILVDQFEVLLRTDEAKLEILFSVIKKLIEHLGRQKALLFIAGSDEGWRKLPRDISPRFRLRDPLQVGDLSLAETTVFLNSYIGEMKGFSADAVVSIHKLSGGNPREIIRIAYHAFEKTKGDLSSATEDTLLLSAQDSGTVADRITLALSMADSVLKQYGAVRQNLAIRDGVIIDRMVNFEEVPFLALMSVRATDKLSEVTLARSVSDVREYLEHEWPGTALIVVAVGYSSEEIRELLNLTASTLIFNESNFTNELETEAAKIAARRGAAKASPVSDPNVLALLERISARLNDLELRRQQESKEVQDRFIEGTAKIAEPERKGREIKTRWETLEELERLENALRVDWIEQQRDIIRSILVANETYRHDDFLDEVGTIYLDLVAVMDGVEGNSDVMRKGKLLGAEMIAAIRKNLRPGNTLSRWFLQEKKAPIVLGLAGMIVWVFTRVLFMFNGPVGLREPLSELFHSFFLFYLAEAILVGLMILGFSCLLRIIIRPIRRWNFRVRELRRLSAFPEKYDRSGVGDVGSK